MKTYLKTAGFFRVLAAVCLMVWGSLAVGAAEDSGLADGIYSVEVTLAGGSGKASVDSPTSVEVIDGQMVAVVTFSSPYYDYMLVDGERYEPVNSEGNSSFEIPLTAFDQEMPVVADTTAMSEPHEISYTLYFASDTVKPMEDGSGASEDGAEDENADKAADIPADGANTDKEADDLAEGANADKAADDSADGANADKTGDVPAASPDAESSTEALQSAAGTDASRPGQEDWCGLHWDHAMELEYAEQFQVDYYEGGYKRIRIADDECFLLVPEGGEVPGELEEGVVVLQQPVENIYLVATSSMDFFCSLDALESIRLSGTNAEGWYIDEAKAALEDGSILYAGKYSAPDYELILAEGCQLAIESTMIFHNPEVKEKLEGFGIPVMVERSSYEPHAMGRSEWIRLYGALLNMEDEAEALFKAQVEQVQALEEEESTGKTVVFFYISSNGYANVRKSDDYVAEMIRLAGGEYVFDDLGDDTSLSTVNMTMEEFYARAKDADYIIYSSTIDGEIYSISELLGKSELLADFKAVKEGNVWCTGKNLFQETTSLGGMIVDIHSILSGTGDEDTLNYLHKVE